MSISLAFLHIQINRKYAKGGFVTVAQWVQKQLVPTFRQSKEKHNDNCTICLCLEICKTISRLNPAFMTDIFKLSDLKKPAQKQNALNLKHGLSTSKKKFVYFNDEKCCLFQLKNSFRSQHISVFAFIFWSYRKNGLTRKIRLIPRIMTSRPGHNTYIVQYITK